MAVKLSNGTSPAAVVAGKCSFDERPPIDRNHNSLKVLLFTLTVTAKSATMVIVGLRYYLIPLLR